MRTLISFITFFIISTGQSALSLPVSYQLSNERTILPLTEQMNIIASSTMPDTYHAWYTNTQNSNLITVTKSGQVLADIQVCDGAPSPVNKTCVDTGSYLLKYGTRRSSILIASALFVAEVDPIQGTWLRYCTRTEDPMMSLNYPTHIAYDEARDQFAWMTQRRSRYGVNITLWSLSTCSQLSAPQVAPEDELIGIRYLADIDAYVVIDPLFRSLYYYSATNNSMDYLTHISLASRITDILACEIDSHGTLVLTSSLGVCLYYGYSDRLNCVDSTPVASPRLQSYSPITFEMNGTLTVIAGRPEHFTMNLLHFQPVAIPSQSSSSSSSGPSTASSSTARPSSSTGAWESSVESSGAQSSAHVVSSTGAGQIITVYENSLSAGSIAGIIIAILVAMVLTAITTAWFVHNRMSKQEAVNSRLASFVAPSDTD